MINEVPVYQLENGFLTTKYIEGEDVITLLEKEGIQYQITITSPNVINEIIESLSNNMPVILQIDCYYQSIKEELFLKSHWPHSILIYGVNEEKKVVYAIEQEYHESLSYQKTEIGYFDIINSYRGYLENFQKGQEIITMYKFNTNMDQIAEELDSRRKEFLEALLKNRKQNKENILVGLESINKYISNLNISTLTNESTGIINGLNNIIHTKKTEKYVLEGILAEDLAIQSKLDSIIKDWNSLRNTVLRASLTQGFNQPIIEKISNYLDGIYSMEKELNELIFRL